jgi:hypothetical protein
LRRFASDPLTPSVCINVDSSVWSVDDASPVVAALAGKRKREEGEAFTYSGHWSVVGHMRWEDIPLPLLPPFGIPKDA